MERNTEQKLRGGNTSPPANNNNNTTDTTDNKKKKCRNYCFTGFPDESGGKYVLDFKENMTYLLIGIETCPTTGRKHNQGFVIWKNPRMLTGVIKEYYGIHWEQCKGTIDQNVEYCQKDMEWEEWGVKPKGRGCREDIRHITADIMEGKNNTELLQAHGDRVLRIYRAVDWARQTLAPKIWRTWMTKGIWYTGPTACGKSHMAFEGYDPETHFVQGMEELKKGWWDNYQGQDTVIFNDFRGEIKYNELLNLLDKWPYVVSRRGRDPVQFLAKTIIITSVLDPEDIYGADSKDDISQLLRRIEIRRMSKRNEPM